MSTATMPRVRSVTAASTAEGSMFNVTGSTSAKTGSAPSRMKQFADATNDNGDVITSSPPPSPAMRQSRCNPAVPLDTAAAYGAPTRAAISSSNCSIHGPRDNRPDRSTSRTSSSSRSSIHGRESGTSRVTGFTLRLVRATPRRTRASAPSARSGRARCRGTPAGSRASPRPAGRLRGRRSRGSASPQRPCRT